MSQLTKNNGQNLLEYVVVIACVVAALIAMQGYIKRAMQGRLRSAADRIGQDQLYEPGKMKEGGFTTTVNREVEITIDPDVEIIVDGKEGHGTRRTDTIKEDETIREGKETVAEFDSSLWE